MIFLLFWDENECLCYKLLFPLSMLLTIDECRFPNPWCFPFTLCFANIAAKSNFSSSSSFLLFSSSSISHLSLFSRSASNFKNFFSASSLYFIWSGCGCKWNSVLWSMSKAVSETSRSLSALREFTTLTRSTTSWGLFTPKRLFKGDTTVVRYLSLILGTLSYASFWSGFRKWVKKNCCDLSGIR